jgi:hypothetical protein
MYNRKAKKWTEEELELLRKVKKISSLVNHPLLINRSYKSIESKLYYLSIKEMGSINFRVKKHQNKRLAKSFALAEDLANGCSNNCLECGICDLSCE